MIKLKESGEMYLETIIILSGESNKVRSIDIAEYMNFSKPSVSRAISILKDDGFINVDNIFRVVVLPAPFVPSRENNSPSFISKFRLLTAILFLYFFVKFSVLIVYMIILLC